MPVPGVNASMRELQVPAVKFTLPRKLEAWQEPEGAQ